MEKSNDPSKLQKISAFNAREIETGLIQINDQAGVFIDADEAIYYADMLAESMRPVDSVSLSLINELIDSLRACNAVAKNVLT